MIDPVLLVALALVAGGALPFAPIATATGAIATAVVLRARASRAALLAALVAAVAGGLRARAALDEAEELHWRTAELLAPPARCAGEAEVVSSPVVAGRAEAARSDRARGPPEAAGSARVDVAIERGSCGDRPVPAGLRARVHGAPEDLARGDTIAFVADLAAMHLFQNEGQRGSLAAIARSGAAASGGAVEVRVLRRGASVRAAIDRARARVRARIEATYDAGAAPLARALVLGETDLAAGDGEAFRASGLAHLLAVSGAHLAIAVVGVCAALRAVLARVPAVAGRIDPGRVAAACGIPASWLYAELAGGGGSARRACLMLTCVLAARGLARRPHAARAFAWSLFAGAALDPLLLCDVSFALSASATAGLLALAGRLSGAIERRLTPRGRVLGASRGPAGAAEWGIAGNAGASVGMQRKLVRAAAATVAATLGCAPVTAVLAPSLPVLGVLANLLAAPIGEGAALPLCLAHAALWWAPHAERGAAIVASGALLAVRAVARVTAATNAVLPVPPPSAPQLAVLCTTLAALWTGRGARSCIARGLAGAAACLALEGAAMRAGSPSGVLRVSVLDVGQGDAVLVDLPGGATMLVDGGGFVGSPVDTGTRVLLPVLRARRKKRIDVAVLSHPHPDHFGGLASALAGLDVGELWDTGQGEREGAGPVYVALLADLRRRGVPIRRPPELCGGPRAIGGASVEILAPCPDVHPDHPPNDNSFVLRLRYGTHAALLAGDAERAEEGALASLGPPALRADFLKTGHHGSRTSSSPGFLTAVSPSVAAISCGVRNRFGHPHAEVVERLEAHGIVVLRTDRGGEIRWETDGRVARLSRPGRL